MTPQYLAVGRFAEQCEREPERYSPHGRGGAKSFVDDLVLGRGVVLSRAATSLRSIETQPWTWRFVCFLRQATICQRPSIRSQPALSGRSLACLAD